jgi:hypothetical protein
MSKSVIYSLSLVLFASLFVFSSTGCRKKGKTIALITVRDSSNQPVEGAMVRLYGQSTTNPPSGPIVRIDTAYTNINGVAAFDYTDVFQLGQAGLFVLNIEARKGILSGSGIIKIVEETTSEQRVFIQ